VFGVDDEAGGGPKEKGVREEVGGDKDLTTTDVPKQALTIEIATSDVSNRILFLFSSRTRCAPFLAMV